MGILIRNVTIILPESRLTGWLAVEDGKIKAFGEGTPAEAKDAQIIDGGGLTLLPGFIDLHMHGALGHDAMDASADGLRDVACFCAQHGVTSFLPTTWTDSHECIMAALKNIAALQGEQPDGATILGAHLEGPYLNPVKCGAQSAGHIRRASREEALELLNLNIIRLVALAPEFTENHWLIEECVRRGITVSVAHTTANYDQMQHAIELGINHATHTFNAMPELNHHEPGAAGAVLTNDHVNCELIADYAHVHSAMMRILFALKGHHHVILITDAVRSAGMPDGDYKLDERVVSVKNGIVRLPDGTLAGSTITLDRALHNFAQVTGESIETLWPTASLNAARAIHVDDRTGSIEVGKDADLVLVDNEVNVYLTIARGKIVYTNSVAEVNSLSIGSRP